MLAIKSIIKHPHQRYDIIMIMILLLQQQQMARCGVEQCLWLSTNIFEHIMLCAKAKLPNSDITSSYVESL
jgi:hypothetical protein